MIVATALLALCAAVLLMPTASDLLSLARVALRPRRWAPPSGEHPRLLFLVPAHNEELLLAACLEALARQQYPADRLMSVVVADNCSDGTASIAGRAGVRCLERQAPTEPGKPRAIAWALQQLEIREVDAVVIVDADTVVDPDFAGALAAAGPLRHKVLQPFNDVSNRTETALTRMAAVLSAANHRFAFALKTRAGLNVPLSAGMCIGTEVLATHGWNAFSICEDWELYALLTEQGACIESVPGARIAALEASSLRHSASQRRRWQGGKLTVLARRWLPLARSNRIGFAQKLDTLAELSTVGPTVQLGLAVLAAGTALLLQPPGASWIVAALLACVVRTGVYTVAALWVDPEPWRAFLAFAFLPGYTVWRLKVALAAPATVGDAPWIRTHRRSLRNHTS